MDVAFIVRVAIVSGLAALAATLVREGGGLLIAGAVIGAVALGGLIGLARIVAAAERRTRERRS